MMGWRTTDQTRLFYELRLEDRMPEGQLLRPINGIVAAALADLHSELTPFYSHAGRPSTDPEPMIRMPMGGLLLWHPCETAALRENT